MNEYCVNHRYKDVLIIPYAGIDKSLTFMLDKGDKYVLTADGIRAKVVSWEEKHICELEKLIREIYNISAWDMICKWYRYCKCMDSMHFLILKLKKDE